MNCQCISLQPEIEHSALPPMSLDRFQELSGWSPATLWRFRKKGWLRTVTISGRHYVPREEIAIFNARAAAGEFAGKIANPSLYRHDADEERQKAA